jgi:hypothetical protein
MTSPRQTPVGRAPGQAGQAAPSSRRARTLAIRAGWWAVAVAVIWGGTAWGLWFLPFAVGVLTGLAFVIRDGKARWAVALASLSALVGWSLPLLARAAGGQPVEGTARVVAAVAGLPPYALLPLAATVLVAIVQAATGVFAGWATTRLFRPGQPPAERQQAPAAGTAEPAQPARAAESAEAVNELA